MIKVVCVYRTGGDYSIEYVRRLALGVMKHLTLPHKFVCLTDEDPYKLRRLVLDEIVPLHYDWPGWWSKIEMFALMGPALYLDLDTVIVGDINPLGSWISESHNALMMLRGFYRKDICSGIMGWNGSLLWIYETFREFASDGHFKHTPRALFLNNKRRSFRGDQEWLRDLLKNRGDPEIIMAQDIFSGICSYKVHVLKAGRLPHDCRIVCFHGRPRPHEIKPVPAWMKGART
ncbi:MAG TPA: hypothetical protein ENO22_05710 [candidate division Zixibacteria bacterium]|nr:hypothetical protein [candidate division Zixibacteria bacterium]